MEISNLTKKRIVEYLEKGKRFDKRELLEYRPISIELDYSKNAEGSAKVKIGETEVVAGVKMSVGEPYTDSPDSGVLVTTVELSPMASEKFEPGPPSIESVELARIVDRGIRESGYIDLKKLCIRKGELVWIVNLDIYPINDAGNLIDASAMAAVAALSRTVFPKLENDKVIFGEMTNKKLPLTEKMPLVLTFYKIGKHIILDPVTEEEEASEARLTVAISTEKKEDFINALQKGGDKPLTLDETMHIIDSAFKNYKKLKEIFNKEQKIKK
ncbi:MAG: exosome complex protein Rrp42 [Candidatus Pacearchaeota archaeon]